MPELPVHTPEKKMANTGDTDDVVLAAANNSPSDDSPTSAAARRPMPTHDFHSAHLENLYVGISGLIGAGKSTLATALAKQMNLEAYYEPVIDNAYLEDFYSDMKRYSFTLQVYLLNQRFKQQQQIVWGGKGGVQDRTIYEDSIFARTLVESGLMEERDYQCYLSLFQNMANFMRKPNLIVHLDVTPEESLRRIKLRNRSMEKSISIDYLRSLHKAYQDFLEDISRVIPVIKVDYNEFRTAEEMAKVVCEAWDDMQNVRYVHWKNDKPKVLKLKKRVPPPTTTAAAPTATTTEAKKTTNTARVLDMANVV